MWNEIKKGGWFGLKWGAIIGAVVGVGVASFFAIASVVAGSVPLAVGVLLAGAFWGGASGAIKGGLLGVALGGAVGVFKGIAHLGSSQNMPMQQDPAGVKMGRSAGLEPTPDMQPELRQDWAKTTQTPNQGQQMMAGR